MLVNAFIKVTPLALGQSYPNASEVTLKAMGKMDQHLSKENQSNQNANHAENPWYESIYV